MKLPEIVAGFTVELIMYDIVDVTMISSIKKLNADKKAMYLNNNHGMLENGLYLLKKLKIVEV
ncbi:MAG: hypothetical protein M3156_04595 [Thermoproteota archaeon]|nr:hypothetical protein [Thermoproteota archaeon]